MYELRHYAPVEGRETALRDRFANGTLQLFERVGIKVVQFWEQTGASGGLWYLVEWPDEAAMQAGWEAFRKNGEWLALKAATEVDGPLTASIRSIPLKSADFFRQGSA